MDRNEKIEVKTGKKNEYDDYMALIDNAFGFMSGGFLGILPKLYRQEYAPCEKNSLVYENGMPKAAVGVYEQEVRCLDKQLILGGIGNVAVVQEARKKGYMKLAMNHAMDRLKADNVDFVFLGGQRQRYRYFGFEPGGISYSFFVGADNLRHAFNCDFKHGYTAEILRSDDEYALNEIAKICEGLPNRVIRPREKLFYILSSWADIPYILKKDGKVIGYFVVCDHYDCVSEYGVTEQEHFLPLIASAISLCKKEEMEFSVPLYDCFSLKTLNAVAEGIRIRHSSQYCIFNFKNVIKAYLSLKNKCCTLGNGVFTCLIHGINGDEMLHIEINNGEIIVENTTESPDIVLTHLEAEHLLLNLYDENRDCLPATCATWFPLPIYFPNPDHV